MFSFIKGTTFVGLCLKIWVNIHWSFNLRYIVCEFIQLNSISEWLEILGSIFIIPLLLEGQYWVFFSFFPFFSIGSLSLLCHRAKTKETGKLTLNMRPSGSYQFPNLKNIFVHRQFRVCWIPRCMPWLHFSQKIIFIVYYDAVQGNISLCIWKRTNK